MAQRFLGTLVCVIAEIQVLEDNLLLELVGSWIL